MSYFEKKKKNVIKLFYSDACFIFPKIELLFKMRVNEGPRDEI